MNILLLSLGGGGGNILRSVKTLYQQDLATAELTDPVYAARLSHSVATRFADTNQYSLLDIPAHERVLIGSAATGHVGARHDPEVARHAVEQSKHEIENLISEYSTIFIIATGGKGTGTGTLLPVTRLARHHKKLVVPVFVRPSFERHEVEKRRYDEALAVSRELDAAGVRFVEILNDRGYVDAHPEPQSAVWERMNVPIARALRGLLYVLWDLSQVDPSDLASLFAGHGRLRVGFSELDPPSGTDPSDDAIDDAVQRCWESRFCNFSQPVGTSLICIQGQWSNVADAKIKSQLAARAAEAGAAAAYNPLYARAFHVPKPWGVTALFAEYTGIHEPVEIKWSHPDVAARPPDDGVHAGIIIDCESGAMASFPTEGRFIKAQTFESFWDLALAINRSDPAALQIAQNGDNGSVAVDPTDLKKLLGTVWFKAAFQHLSQTWRDRLLDVLVDSVVIPDHVVRLGRRDLRLRSLGHAELKELFSKSSVTEAVRSDIRLLMAVSNLWGAESVTRFQFAEGPHDSPVPSKFSVMMQGLRR